MNIIGSEWIMIIFIALILLLGTNRFPDVAKKIGRLVGEYHNAKNQIQTEMKDVTKENFEVSGPVKDERKKLEIMAPDPRSSVRSTTYRERFSSLFDIVVKSSIVAVPTVNR